MSKGIFWSDPNVSLEILPKTEAAARKYHKTIAADVIHLKQEHILALQNGQMLAFNDSEYTTFLVLGDADLE